MKKYITPKNHVMKNLSFSMLLIIGFINQLFGQVNTVPVPEFINIPYLVKGNHNELANLSKETVNMPAKYKTVFWELVGTTSGLRISSSETYMFIIKSGDADPTTMVNLYKMDITKKSRRAEMLSSPVWGHKVDHNSRSKINYRLEKISDKIYKIITDSTLTPGEYMFLNGMTAYSFGID
jgi:hypothetical protein